MDWKTLEALKDKNVHVVGLSSVEGSAVAAFLVENGFTAITAHDFKGPQEFERSYKRVHVGLTRRQRDEAFERLRSLPIVVHYQDTYLEGIREADAIFATQAWFLYEPNYPRLQEAKEAGIPFHSMTELYFDLAPCPIIAVTGTNGKSTTAKLISEIIRAGPIKTYFAGNDRQNVQVLDKIKEMRPEDVLVLEVSNRQLLGLGRSPHIAVITNLAPNHLDEHPSFEDYVETKRGLITYQTADDFAVLNHDNEITRRMIEGCPSQPFPFSRTQELERGAFVKDGDILVRREGREERVCSVGEIRLAGDHNLENVLAAVAAAYLRSVDVKTIGHVVSRFGGLKHRIQFVWEMGGIRYYDDLSSTTPQATAAALRALPEPILLIAGGDDKGLDYSQLGQIIVERVKALILLPGQGAEKISRAVERAQRAGGRRENPLLVRHPQSLEEAVVTAARLAQVGDTVLLSPACPFFFSLYYLDENGEERGFKALLRKMASARRGSTSPPPQTDRGSTG